MPRFSRIALNFLPPVVGESLGEGRLLTAAIGGNTPLLGQHGVVDSECHQLVFPGPDQPGWGSPEIFGLSFHLLLPSCSVFLPPRSL